VLQENKAKRISDFPEALAAMQEKLAQEKAAATPDEEEEQDASELHAEL
jgi:hypothetical protein